MVVSMVAAIQDRKLIFFVKIHFTYKNLDNWCSPSVSRSTEEIFWYKDLMI